MLSCFCQLCSSSKLIFKLYFMCAYWTITTSVFISGEIPPYHYGTHYSSTMIVASYLIRLEPFTQHFLRVQVMAMCSFLFSFRYTCPDVYIKTVLLLHLHPDPLTPPPLSHTYKTSLCLQRLFDTKPSPVLSPGEFRSAWPLISLCERRLAVRGPNQHGGRQRVDSRVLLPPRIPHEPQQVWIRHQAERWRHRWYLSTNLG